MNFGGVALLTFAIGIFLATLRYILFEKNRKNTSYGRLLLEILSVNGYKKAKMPNEYPTYTGELENKDTEEYLEFISPDILELIKWD